MTVTFKGGGDDPPDNVINLNKALGVSGSHMTLVKTARVTKQDREVLSGSQMAKDDVWEQHIFDPKNPTAKEAPVLRPPYEPQQLSWLCQHNNSLGQMISAMEVNIDGSGWVVERKEMSEEEEEPEEDPPLDALTQWFEEPFPRISFTTIRRNLRRDLERVGYGFLEVLRSIDGQLTFVKRIPVDEMRLVKLDEPVMVDQVITREGEEITVRMPVRERRFAQIQGKKVVYFKEYAASRELDRKTGKWAEENETLDVEDRATEVLYFKIHDDARSPYGVPRWINQIPSVLGSRKAEELNLDFFNSGGLPPALIIIQGGTLTEEVRKQLNAYLSGKGSSIHRAGIVEVHSSGGSIDSPGNVRVTVERFGSERMQDSMFENYDERCELRVRGAFRLPPIFMGKAQDYSYATAFASYTVAEAQVFMPERMEFDEVINNTIMRELDSEGIYQFRSLGLTVNDVQTQLEALGFVKGEVEREELVDAVNEVTGMKLKPKEGPDAAPVTLGPDGQPIPAVTPSPAGLPPEGGLPNQPQPAAVAVSRSKGMDTFDMMELVSRWCLAQLSDEVPDDEVVTIKETIQRMSSDDRERFDGYCTLKLMSGFDHDPRGAVELFGAASMVDGCQH